jgi:class 3 adenylate cyclase
MRRESRQDPADARRASVLDTTGGGVEGGPSRKAVVRSPPPTSPAQTPARHGTGMSAANLPAPAAAVGSASSRSQNNSGLNMHGIKPESIRSGLALNSTLSRRYTSLVSDETKVLFKKRFAQRQTDDAVSIEEFFDLLAEVQEVVDNNGVVYNAGLVHKMYSVSDAEAVGEALTLRDCFILLGRFIARGQEHDQRITDETRQRNAHDSLAGEVTFVGFGEYARKHATCRPRRKGDPIVLWTRIPPVDRQVALMLMAAAAALVIAVLVVGITGSIAQADAMDTQDITGDALDELIRAATAGSAEAAVATVTAATAAVGRTLSPAMIAVMAEGIARRGEGLQAEATALAAAGIRAAEEAVAAARQGAVEAILRPLVDISTSTTRDGDDGAAAGMPLSVVTSALGTWVAADSAGEGVDVVAAVAAAAGSTPQIVFRTSPGFFDDNEARQALARSAIATTTGGLQTAVFRSYDSVILPGLPGLDLWRTDAATAECVTLPSGAFAALGGELTVCVFHSKIFRLRPDARSRLVATDFFTATPAVVAASCRTLYREYVVASDGVWLVANPSAPSPPSAWWGAPGFLPTMAEMGAAADATPVDAAAITLSRSASVTYGAQMAVEHRAVVVAVRSTLLGYDVAGVCDLEVATGFADAQGRFAAQLADVAADTTRLAPANTSFSSGGLTYQPREVIRRADRIPFAEYPGSAFVLGASGTSAVVDDTVNDEGVPTVAAVVALPEAMGIVVEGFFPRLAADARAAAEDAVRRIAVSRALSDNVIVYLIADDATMNRGLYYAVEPPFCPTRYEHDSELSRAVCVVSANARHAFFRRQTIRADETDNDGGGGESFTVTYTYVGAANAVVAVASRHDPSARRTWAILGIMIGVAAVLLLACAAIVKLLTGHVLDRIETEYVVYKQQIEDEKKQFSELVKDVMPSFISARVISGEQLIVDQHPMLTFLFSDVVGCGDLLRHRSTVEMVRLLGYTFMLQDNVAEHFRVHKLKTIGDAFFCVAGLEDVARKKEAEQQRKHQQKQQQQGKGGGNDSGKARPPGGGGEPSSREAQPGSPSLGAHESSYALLPPMPGSPIPGFSGSGSGGNGGGSLPSGSPLTGPQKVPGSVSGISMEQVLPEDNQVLRMVSFAVVVQQLLGGEYVHYPERTDCFKASAGRDLGRMEMVSMQMGIHCGPAIAGVVDVGRAPHFDCFGPSVNLASRMETTALTDRLQISAPTHDLLKNVDRNGLFTWDPPKKTLIKGYGTLNTYTIRATTLRVPEAIIQRLNVERAVVLRYFTEQGLLVGGAGEGREVSDADMLSHQDSMRSHRQSEASA